MVLHTFFVKFQFPVCRAFRRRQCQCRTACRSTYSSPLLKTYFSIRIWCFFNDFGVFLTSFLVFGIFLLTFLLTFCFDFFLNREHDFFGASFRAKKYHASTVAFDFDLSFDFSFEFDFSFDFLF